MREISEKLHMPISNWNELQSDRDYNAYYFTYKSILGVEGDFMLSYVKVETALSSYAFPTNKITIGIDIDNVISNFNEELLKAFTIDKRFIRK